MAWGTTLDRLRGWDERLRSWDVTGFRPPRWLRPLRRLDVRVFGSEQRDPATHRRLRFGLQILPAFVPLGFAIHYVLLGHRVGYLFIGLCLVLIAMASVIFVKNQRYWDRRWAARANNPGS